MKYIKIPDQWIEEPNRKKGLVGKLFNLVFKPNIKNTNHVIYWILEVNNQGEVSREIGIDINNQIVDFAPNRNNRGLWVDSNILLNPYEYEEVTLIYFEDLWGSIAMNE